MTTTVTSYSSTGFTFAASYDALYVLSGGAVYNTSGNGVFATNYAYVYDYGSIIGVGYGIRLDGGGRITITASGTVGGNIEGIDLSGSTDIFNAGSITGAYGVYANTGNFNVNLNNTGTIVATGGYSYLGSSGVDRIVNSGVMSGDIFLDSGNDFYDGRGGTVIGTVYGSRGNDVLVGGSGEDKLYDYTGSNWIVGGGGDDTVTIGNYGASNGTTTAWAGEANFGTDNSTNDTLLVDGSGANIFLGGTVFNAASGAVAGWIWGFENATGTGYADSIVGTAGNNIINGGGGADWLVGGGGYDQFVFGALDTSGSTIADYSRDIIDLHNIDANTATASDDPFAYRTAHTNNTAAEMVFTNYSSGGKFDLYVNADNIIDATVYIAYAAGTTAPTASDFWL
jgi:RTX calcium-binding nonapeptide repeat (4 copies)